MQVNIPFRALAGGGGGFNTNGGTVTTPLVLSGNPVDNLQAAPKQYVDSKISSIPSSALTSGTLSASRFPALTGDVSSVAGSGIVNLSTTSVTTGTYTKVTVNSKGRVTDATNISKDDLPSVSWSKINVGKPATLAGYGITDALNKSGGTLTGSLTTAVTPTHTLHAVNKSYVDGAIGTTSGLSVGDIVRKSTSTTPTGYLRCNGQ